MKTYDATNEVLLKAFRLFASGKAFPDQPNYDPTLFADPPVSPELAAMRERGMAITVKAERTA